jgi:hypothetical protein
MRTTVRNAVAGLAVVAATALLTGCGADDKIAEKSVEKAIEDSASDNGEDVDVDIDDDKVTITGEDGTVTWGGTERPKSLPEDFPLPDGEITYAMDGPDGAMVTMDVDDAEEAFDDALAELELDGWKRVSVTESGTAKVAMLQGESESESVMMTADSEAGNISFIVSIGS